MDGKMNGNEIRPSSLEALDRLFSPVRRAVVDDPKDTLGRTIGFLPHDLGDQLVKRDNAGLGLAAAKQLGPSHVPSGQVHQGPRSVVFVFDTGGLAGAGRQARMATGTRLHARLLIGRKDKVPIPQGLLLPKALVQIQNPASFFPELRISREHPRPVIPGPKGVLTQPSPNGGPADLRHQAALHRLVRQVRHTQAGQGQAQLSRTFTSHGLHLNDELRGKKTEVAPVPDGFADRPDVPGRSASAICSPPDAAYPSVCRSRRCRGLLPPEVWPWHEQQRNTLTYNVVQCFPGRPARQEITKYHMGSFVAYNPPSGRHYTTNPVNLPHFIRHRIYEHMYLGNSSYRGREMKGSGVVLQKFLTRLTRRFRRRRP